MSCGEGVKKKHRTCSNPAPSVYGHYCIGDAVDFDICHEQPCNNMTKCKYNLQYMNQIIYVNMVFKDC